MYQRRTTARPSHIAQLSSFLFLLPTSPQKKHNGSLYDFDGIYEVCVKDFAPLLRRHVFTGLIDSSCFFLPSTFSLSIAFLQLLCHSTALAALHHFTIRNIATRNTTTITNFTEIYQATRLIRSTPQYCLVLLLICILSFGIIA